MLSQLSYVPPRLAVRPDRSGRTLFFLFPVGVPRLELGTSSLSGMRSNQLSYTPAYQELLSADKRPILGRIGANHPF